MLEINEWLIIGDLNEILILAEREGHGIFDVVGAQEFSNVIISLTELESCGGYYTWSNGTNQ